MNEDCEYENITLEEACEEMIKSIEKLEKCKPTPGTILDNCIKSLVSAKNTYLSGKINK